MFKCFLSNLASLIVFVCVFFSSAVVIGLLIPALPTVTMNTPVEVSKQTRPYTVKESSAFTSIEDNSVVNDTYPFNREKIPYEDLGYQFLYKAGALNEVLVVVSENSYLDAVINKYMELEGTQEYEIHDRCVDPYQGSLNYTIRFSTGNTYTFSHDSDTNDVWVKIE